MSTEGEVGNAQTAATKLGQLLRNAGLITEEELQIALEQQKRTGERLGSILVSLGIIDEQSLLEALGISLGSLTLT